jgi:hypothetical protein
MIGILSVFGAIGSIAYVNSPGITGSLAEVVVFWINFGLHIVLTLVWIASECMKCNANHSGHATTVTVFGVLYVFLFILDIATAVVMIVYGIWFITAGAVTALSNTTISAFSDATVSGFSSVTNA